MASAKAKVTPATSTIARTMQPLHRVDPALIERSARIADERELRSIARGRKAWLFVGSDRGGKRAAMMYSLIGTARLNGVDPLTWLTDVLARIADLPQSRLHEPLPWE